MAFQLNGAYVRANWKRLLYTAIILVTHFSYGIIANIIGATLVDLRFIYGVSVDTSSYFSMSVQGGYLLGSLIGFVYRWVNRQLALVFFIALLGVTSALTAHYSLFVLVMAALLLSGIGGGAWDASSGFWMVEMWPVGNAFLLQFMQFTYGGGTILSPLIAAPFVKGEALVENGHNITVEDRISALTLPFALTGVLPVIISILLLLFYFTCRYKASSPTEPSADSSEKLPPQPDPEVVPYRLLKLAMCGVCLAADSTLELAWFNYSTSMYQYIDIKLDAQTAANLASVVSATYTLGRFTTSFITFKLSPDTIISYHLVTILVALLTIFLGRNSLTVITVGSAIYGYGISAMWPAILAFTERHLRLTDRICSVYSFLAGFFSLVTPLILGQTFNSAPLMLFAIEALFYTLCIAMFIGVKLWIEIDAALKRRREQNSKIIIN